MHSKNRGSERLVGKMRVPATSDYPLVVSPLVFADALAAGLPTDHLIVNEPINLAKRTHVVEIELTNEQARDLSRDLEHLVQLSPATFYDPRSAISELRKLVWQQSIRR